ncbi:MAG: hypothetical protein C4548_10610 [Desulfobacteraceae bacterium]|jgi:hypothetical protein|nr:MAG: hypothetical protein C4548_10610 [Desulfobacteraceae bacterium]
MRPNVTPDKFVEWSKQQPEEFLREGNEIEHLQAERDYEKFANFFKEARCSLCMKSLKTFSAKSPCLHWLLRPKGFKKKHFPLLYEEFTYFRMSAYVRWVASLDGPMKNINDIQAEHPGNKLIDFTAKYQHITWSFSCGSSDFEGHKNSNYGNFPHYHMQIKLNGSPFINYGDFHIPFHKDDLFDIELFTKHKDFAIHSYGHGTGMQDLMGSASGLEFIVDHSSPIDNPEDAAYSLSTMIMTKEGETISGDFIADAMEKAKETGKTFASVIRERLKDDNASIATIVSPGDGVPEAQQRTGGRKKKG